MNKTLKSYCHNLSPGTYIRGKWHNNHYLIKSKLGSGAVGTVYLCEINGNEAALKISDQSSSMTVEVNVLKSLGKVQGNRLGPSLLDVDDWETRYGMTYTFYVMEYLRGESLLAFITDHGDEWVLVFMLQLLEDLDRLHQVGWVFGDLKTDNLLVLTSPPRIRFIDVGGTTQIGRAIKEYTEFYDRGYWGMGTRRAEPSYDLFALVMVILHLFHSNQFKKGTDSKQILFTKIDEIHLLHPFSGCLKKAIQGKYISSAAMREDLTKRLYRLQRRKRARQKGKLMSMPAVVELTGLIFIAISYYMSSLLIL